MDVIIVSNIWNLNVYTNLMYLTNIKLYLTIYSLFVLMMVLMSIYVMIKNYKKITVRQEATKQ